MESTVVTIGPMRHVVMADGQGRLLLPQEMRERLGVEPRAENLSELLPYLGPTSVEALEATGIVQVVPADRHCARIAAQMGEVTRAAGLSLGDRAYRALARTSGLPVLTADTAWATVDGGARVELIRGGA
jgi:PIN domain nuclease of toxin-antitoxin system